MYYKHPSIIVSLGQFMMIKLLGMIPAFYSAKP
jgi:hypothetical protein